MPLNVMDAHYNSFEKKVLPVLVKHGIGVLGMKPMGDKIILRSRTATPVECLHYAMSLPTSVVITGCESMNILQQALDAARSFKPFSQQEVAQLLAKTAPSAVKGEFELYKTTHTFDGTIQNPQWLGDPGLIYQDRCWTPTLSQKTRLGGHPVSSGVWRQNQAAGCVTVREMPEVHFCEKPLIYSATNRFSAKGHS